MRAIQIDGFDAPLRLREVPTPAPGPGEVLLRVRAAGVNAADWPLWHGVYRSRQEHRYPITLGFDMAGVVERPGGVPHRRPVRRGLPGAGRIRSQVEEVARRPDVQASRSDVRPHLLGRHPGVLAHVEAVGLAANPPRRSSPRSS
jgi:NADPH:quinone reductase-like Zn-dependent oxidoreductase